MFTILPATRSSAPRSLAGTITSLFVHGVVIAGAVALTMTRPADARSREPRASRPPLVWIARKDGVRPGGERQQPAREALWKAPGLRAMRAIPDPGRLPEVVSPDVGGEPGNGELTLGTGIPTTGLPSTGGSSGLGTATVLREDEVDRAPQVIGAAPQPRYPDVLRAAGITGRVVVEFVVDTLGRAELGTMDVKEGTRPEFAESVRAALPRFRFMAGEAGGRRVRTRVRMPFAFTITGFRD